MAVQTDRRFDQLDQHLLPAIQHELTAFLTAKSDEACRVDPRFAVAVDTLRRFVLGGGKRIRPTFAWWGWRGAGGTPGGPEARRVLRAISALELVHACALVHDDLMDDSTTRRGGPTVHVDFAAQHQAAGWRGLPERFGAAIAILLGDVALAWADDMLRGAGLCPDQQRRAFAVWQLMRTELMGGQYLDVLAQASGDEAPEIALRIGRYKTAAYTVERPLHLGAAIGSAPPELIRAYRRFGADIGVAFQLRDDLLGVFGDPEVTGKPAGDDLRDGKRTLLLSYGLRAADEQGHRTAARLLRCVVADERLADERLGEGLGEQAVASVREVLVDLGAVAQVERRITQLTESALASLRTVDLAEPVLSALTDLATRATHRKS